MGIDENYNLNLKPAVKTILETTKKTNVILNAIPKRFYNERLNFETCKANKQIHRLVNNKAFEKNSKNFIINFKTETMNRNYFTKHGLHLTNLGKNTLTERLAVLTKEIIGSKGLTLNGGREEKEQVKPTFLEIWLGLKKSK